MFLASLMNKNQLVKSLSLLLFIYYIHVFYIKLFFAIWNVKKRKNNNFESGYGLVWVRSLILTLYLCRVRVSFQTLIWNSKKIHVTASAQLYGNVNGLNLDIKLFFIAEYRWVNLANVFGWKIRKKLIFYFFY
jgi:hypothetical protein